MRKRENDAISPFHSARNYALSSFPFHKRYLFQEIFPKLANVWKSVIEINCMFVGPSFMVDETNEEEFDLISNQKKIKTAKSYKTHWGYKAIKVVVHLFPENTFEYSIQHGN